MIQINLLPNDLRPIKRTPLPYILSVLVLMITVAVIAALHLGVVAQVASQRAERDNNVRRLEELKPIVDEANELTLKKEQLAARIETINEIVMDRILWSRQLWNISRLAPENVWFSGFSTETKRVQQTVREVRPDGTSVDRRETIQQRVFRVSGYLVDTPEGARTIGAIINALNTDPEFSSVFELDAPTFQPAEFDGYPVRRFTIDFTIGARPAR
jgi:Tfp pilus assembly protein PilN